MSRTKYEDLTNLPLGRAKDIITEGCMVLEGGGWRGVYTVGVLDALMENDINLSATVGISAGGLCGLGYTTGQIGWGIRIDLLYRHDPRYCGRKALRDERAITGFKYLYKDILAKNPLDKKKLKETPRRLVVGATDMYTGRTRYFEKGKCNLSAAVCASASVPYASKPIIIDGVPYLDGGCSTKVPYYWAKENGYDKIVVIKTRDRSYKRKEGKNKLARAFYHKYPNFVKAIEAAPGKWNDLMSVLYEEEKKGNVFIIAPSEKVKVKRFEGNIDKLADLYWLGYKDGYDVADKLKEYLGIKNEK